MEYIMETSKSSKKAKEVRSTTNVLTQQESGEINMVELLLKGQKQNEETKK